MIGSFRDRRLKRYYARGETHLLPVDMLTRIGSILARLGIAESIDDLRLHSYSLHPLKGYWSITVKANWRIIFRFVMGKSLI